PRMRTSEVAACAARSVAGRELFDAGDQPPQPSQPIAELGPISQIAVEFQFCRRRTDLSSAKLAGDGREIHPTRTADGDGLRPVFRLTPGHVGANLRKQQFVGLEPAAHELAGFEASRYAANSQPIAIEA